MKSVRLLRQQGILFALTMVISVPAIAWEEGDKLLRFGASVVDPKSVNHPVVSAGIGTSLTFNFAYMMTRNWSVEIDPYVYGIHLGYKF